jgi:folate-binding protein YgfZ
MKNIDSFVTALEDLAVVEISGADAAHFLNSQLTQDVASLAPGRACLAGYCTAKGRLLGSMVVWPDPAEPPRLRALVKADLAQALVKRLSMFVLRAKAKLTVETAPVFGVALRAESKATDDDTAEHPSVGSWLAAQGLGSNADPYDTVFNASGTWVAAPCATADSHRWWFVPASLSTGHPAGSNRPGDWQALDITAGLPWVEAATQDLFIPQTLNLDLIGGVSFTKGCYPGQEVVARSHYRGTVKRRMARGLLALPDQGAMAGEGSAAAAASGATTATPENQSTLARPGVDIFDAKSPDNPCGRIINAARCTAGTVEHVLMEVQLADLEGADFRLERPDGLPIQIQPLPYEIKPAA